MKELYSSPEVQLSECWEGSVICQSGIGDGSNESVNFELW